MRRLTIILFLLFSFSVFGQRVDSVKSFLNEKSFKKLDKYLTGINSGQNIRYTQVLNRQIISRYSEISLDFEELIPSEAANIFDKHVYKIYLLTSGDRIIHCKMDNHSDVRSTITELNYSNEDSINSLQKAYSMTYHRTVSPEDFFNSKVIYGANCGFTGNGPEYRKKLDELVKSNNITELDNWLTSPVAELQVYAVDGIFQLTRNNYKPNKTQLDLIKTIKAKKGSIRVCSGCMNLTNTITDAVSDFQF